MSDTAGLGRRGEETAAKYLKKHGYKILARNVHVSHKEIDIIASDSDYIVFAEVKTRSVASNLRSAYGVPSSAVDMKKQRNLICAARAFLAENPTDKQPRMDVIEVYIDKDTGNILDINHIRNAYLAV